MRFDDGTAPEDGADGAVLLPREQVFHHAAFFYSGEDEFIEGTVPFLTAALEADEPALVAVSEARISLLKEALGDDASRLKFADMHLLGSNPARIIPVWPRFLDEHAPAGASARGIGEPIWDGRSDA